MYAIINMGYNAESSIKKLEQANYERLAANFDALSMPPYDEREGWSLDYAHRYDLKIDLQEIGPMLLEFSIPFELKRLKSCYKAKVPGTVHQLQVAIPNTLLWEVNEVLLKEDACTDAIQNLLDDGWRILAICPPACQRRPDYILGRQKRDDD